MGGGPAGGPPPSPPRLFYLPPRFSPSPSGRRGARPGRELTVFVNRYQRGERLLAHPLHLGANVHQYRRLHHPSLALPADEHLRPLPDRLLHPRLRPDPLLLLDPRPHVAILLQRVTSLEFFRLLDA